MSNEVARAKRQDAADASRKRGERLTELYVSPEAMEDIRRWMVDDRQEGGWLVLPLPDVMMQCGMVSASTWPSNVLPERYEMTNMEASPANSFDEVVSAVLLGYNVAFPDLTKWPDGSSLTKSAYEFDTWVAIDANGVKSKHRLPDAAIKWLAGRKETGLCSQQSASDSSAS